MGPATPPHLPTWLPSPSAPHPGPPIRLHARSTSCAPCLRATASTPSLPPADSLRARFPAPPSNPARGTRPVAVAVCASTERENQTFPPDAAPYVLHR